MSAWSQLFQGHQDAIRTARVSERTPSSAFGPLAYARGSGPLAYARGSDSWPDFWRPTLPSLFCDLERAGAWSSETAHAVHALLAQVALGAALGDGVGEALLGQGVAGLDHLGERLDVVLFV